MHTTRGGNEILPTKASRQSRDKRKSGDEIQLKLVFYGHLVASIGWAGNVECTRLGWVEMRKKIGPK